MQAIEWIRRRSGIQLDDAELPPTPGRRFFGDTPAQGALATPGLSLHAMRHGNQKQNIDSLLHARQALCRPAGVPSATERVGGRWLRR
jgi:hypothetical protein